MKQVYLYQSTKVYALHIEPAEGGFHVHRANGPRNGTLQRGLVTKAPLPLAAAEVAFEKKLAEQLGKGYTPGPAFGTPYTPAAAAALPGQCQHPTAVPAAQARALVADPAWCMQEKKDGVRMQLHVTANGLVAYNKKGKAIACPFLAAAQLPVGTHLDGEAVGGTYYCFDALALGDTDLRAYDFDQRLRVAQSACEFAGLNFVPAAYTTEEKLALLEQLQAAGAEGVVLKRRSAPYTPGKPSSGGDQHKLKFVEEATCRVVGQRGDKASIAVELRDGADWVSVGSVTVPPNQRMPQPGGWWRGRRTGTALPRRHLAQPVLKGVRTDVDESDCSLSQLKYKADV